MIINEKVVEKINKDGFVACSISGKSMLPLIAENKDKVLIEKSDVFDLYDVVLYKAYDEYVLHRIINKDGNNYIIRGDNTLYKEIVNKNDVIGKLKAIYYKGGYREITKNINRKYYYLSLISFPFRKIVHYIQRNK